MVTIKECREILKDYKSSDEQIKSRIEYLDAFCRNVIRIELEKYEKENSN